jgi:fumarate hydratase class II
MKDYRIERDSLGEVRVPAHAYYGAQTQRAVENFPISGLRLQRAFIRALGLVKKAAAETNMELGLLSDGVGLAIVQAAEEVAEGQLDEHFVVDVFQTGSRTSTNMNANEVIANRAVEIIAEHNEQVPVHPNDHVNLGQSSNDVIPTAIHISAREEIEKALLPSMIHFVSVLDEKAHQFDGLVKIGRTHLQDAVPIRLGQEFSGYASMLKHSIRRVESVGPHLAELAIGGTAVGTGLNCHPEFPSRVVARVSDWTGLEFWEAENRFEALAGRDAAVETSGMLKTYSATLAKIANDLRWLASGPRCGLGEINLPPTQPGSSIMPGKVNPVIPEAVLMVTAQVFGNDVTINVAGQSGNLELNTMMPVIAYNLLSSIQMLASGTSVLADRCVNGISANESHLEDLIERSLALVTPLALSIGYDEAASIAQEAFRSGRTIREVCSERAVLPEEELERILDPWSMTDLD